MLIFGKISKDVLSVTTSLCACLFVCRYRYLDLRMSVHLCYHNKIILPLLRDMKLPGQFAAEEFLQFGG